jgi:hypothetical protein
MAYQQPVWVRLRHQYPAQPQQDNQTPRAPSSSRHWGHIPSSHSTAKRGKADRDEDPHDEDKNTYTSSLSARRVAVVTCTNRRMTIVHDARVASQTLQIFPRQAPVSRPRASMKALNRSRSPCTRNETAPNSSPTFSTKPSGR